MASLTVENYVKAIYLIASKQPEGADGVVPTGEIAVALNVTPGTVTGMLKTLTEAGLISYTRYEGAQLTDPGKRLALLVLRRHRLIELFLSKTLKLSWDEVHEEAENIEHAVSDRLVDRIDAFLNHPETDPHGDPIPSAEGVMPETGGTPLAQLNLSDKFKVVRVVDQDSAFLRYLTECGFSVGVNGSVSDKRPESGAIVINIKNRSIALGLEAAGKVLVSLR